jgi:hypothetical protein
MKEFTVNGITYMETEKGYFYKVEAGKKIRIKKGEYEMAWDEYMANANDQADVDEWQAEADADLEAREQKQAESDKMAEEAVNDKPKKVKKPRKSRDIAFEYEGLTLTKKQVAFITAITKDDFYEHGLDSTLWIDCLCDTVADIFNPMAVGAMVSTLREKELIYVDVDRVNGKKCKFFGFTPLGKRIAKELGLN